MLRVTLLGNMGGDPEVRFSQKGTQIAAFSVAVNQIRTGPDGERQENTEWFRVKVAGRQVDFVQRLSKGTKVLVIGRLDISHYKNRDGEPRTGFDVWADDVQSTAPRGFGGELDSAPEGDGESPRAWPVRHPAVLGPTAKVHAPPHAPTPPAPEARAQAKTSRIYRSKRTTDLGEQKLVRMWGRLT